MAWEIFVRMVRSGKSLLHIAAEKAYHSEIAFRDASRAMRGTTYALREMHDKLGSQAPKKLASDVHRTMCRVERHAKILRRHTMEMRAHMETLAREVERAKGRG